MLFGVGPGTEGDTKVAVLVEGHIPKHWAPYPSFPNLL